jgi:hypothetical protein
LQLPPTKRTRFNHARPTPHVKMIPSQMVEMPVPKMTTTGVIRKDVHGKEMPFSTFFYVRDGEAGITSFYTFITYKLTKL